MQGLPVGTELLMELVDEQAWLHYRIVRLRTALRFAVAPETQTILRELIGNGEERLIALEQDYIERRQVPGTVDLKASFRREREGGLRLLYCSAAARV
jgi:hypothetical protein